MVIVLILVFAFICLCLWNLVKTEAENDGGPDDLSTEHAEEIFDERFDDVYGRM